MIRIVWILKMNGLHDCMQFGTEKGQLANRWYSRIVFSKWDITCQWLSFLFFILNIFYLLCNLIKKKKRCKNAPYLEGWEFAHTDHYATSLSWRPSRDETLGRFPHSKSPVPVVKWKILKINNVMKKNLGRNCIQTWNYRTL